MDSEQYILVDNFHKSYDDNPVHRGVSFYVDKGKCCGLLGGSGQGKSVILRSLIGLENADEGKILIKGKDITNMNEEELVHIRTNVSYAFQGGALFDSLTVFENVAYPLREHTKLDEKIITEKVYEILSELSLDDTEKLYPAELSGGMQKRVGIARALIMNPDIILYDEPTAGLDPVNTIKIQNIINRLKKRGVTSILVTHDMPTALAVCDDILLLHDGKIRARVSADELRGDKEHTIYKFMHGMISKKDLDNER